MSESPELSGLLYKRRGGFGKIMPNAWQYRFFTLSKDGVLQYFDTEMPDTDTLDSRARGRLDLRNLSYDVSTDPIEGAPTQFPIQINIVSEETWKMCAYGKDDQLRWIKALEKFQHDAKGKTGGNTAPYVSDDEPDKSKKGNVPDVLRSPRSGSIHNSSSGPELMSAMKSEGTKSPTFKLNSDPSFHEKLTEIKATPASAGVGDTITSVPPVNPQSTAPPKMGRRGSIKKRLKLGGAKSLIEQETGESFVVLIILNICFLGVQHTPMILWKCFYVIVANFVIAHTLSLRASRFQKAAANQKTEETTTSASSVANASQVHHHATAVSASATGSSTVVSSSTVVEEVQLQMPTEETPVGENEGPLIEQNPQPGLGRLHFFGLKLTLWFCRLYQYSEGRRRSQTSSRSYLVDKRSSSI
jgi:hypothetical protein